MDKELDASLAKSWPASCHGKHHGHMTWFQAELNTSGIIWARVSSGLLHKEEEELNKSLGVIF